MSDTAPAPPTGISPHALIAAEMVSAYVAKNPVPASDLPNLLISIHAALIGLGSPQQTAAEAPALTPAVPIKKSVTDDFIISLEDGRKFKSMKRYLAGLGMTPAEYRAKWGLPDTYPMVAPNYAKQRSDLAKTMGLGVPKKTTAAAPKPAKRASTKQPAATA